MSVSAKPLPWWEASSVILFGIAVPILPMVLSLVALWCGREIARDPRRKLTRRQQLFINVGLVIVTFLVVTGRLWEGEPLQVGWASVMGFGIGMNGVLIFELFQRFTYNVFSLKMGDRPLDPPAGPGRP